MANTFIAVEGQHDLELACGLLEPEGFKKVVLLEQLNGYFGRIVDTRFPHQGDLHRRVPNPMFLRGNGHWVAVQAAGGDTAPLIRRVRSVMDALRPFPGALSAVGIVRDADELTAANQFAAMLDGVGALRQVDGYDLKIPVRPGEIADGSPRLGVFIPPDNADKGTADDWLMECGRSAYPGLISGAQSYVDGVDLSQLDKKDSELFNKPAGRKKAVVACAANILKPGMSIATSIDQNRWLNEQTRALPRIAAFAKFLKALCGIA